MQLYDKKRVAVEARCDERSVQKWLDGVHLRESLASRIREAIDKLGIKAEPKTPAAAGPPANGHPFGLHEPKTKPKSATTVPPPKRPSTAR